MADTRGGAVIHGRDAERARLTAILAAAEAGRPAALLLRGPAGIGKTALLDELAARAAHGSRFRVLRVAGVETESDLPYAALHLLLRPVEDRLGDLPEGPREALRAALGRSTGPANRFQTGLGVLTLLADLSGEGPVLLLADDAQWLDRESADALTFAVRRLHAEAVGVALAARDGAGLPPMPDVPELHLTGLSDTDADRLLTTSSPGLSVSVRDRLLHEAEGNPLALLELPRALSDTERTGGHAPPAPTSVAPGTLSSRVLRGFRDRIRTLPPATRTALLVIASAVDTDADPLLAAVHLAGASTEDVARLERADLVRVAVGAIALRHPLVRTAAQADADLTARINAHRALAEAFGGDRAVLHRAAAATGHDEALAAELDAVAGRAEARGALSVAAATAERAAGLGAVTDRVRRLAYAAAAALETGDLDRAGRLARAADTDGDPVAARQLAGVRALITFERGDPTTAARILTDHALPAAEATPAHLSSVIARTAIYAWHGAAGTARRDIFDRLAAVADTPVAGLVAGLRAASDGDPAAAVPPLRTYVSESDGADTPFPGRLAAAYAALFLGDHRRVLDLAESLVDQCRREGRLTLLPHPLGLAAVARLMLGDTAEAREALDEARKAAEDTGQHHRHAHLTGVAAWLHAVAAEPEAATAAAQTAEAAATGRGWTAAIGWAQHARTVLDLQHGRLRDALDRLVTAADGPAGNGLSLGVHTLPDLAEAAARLGEAETSHAATARYTAWANATGRPWALAVAERCAALLADDPEPGYRRALDAHEIDDANPLEHARTLLAYGAWLRRSRRRADAAAHLDPAAALFRRLGATGWAARAEDELRATGYRPPEPAGTSDPLAALTPQERRIVRLAATGASNKDIAARLYLSPRTVGYHLYKAFPKLGVASRAELAGLAGT